MATYMTMQLKEAIASRAGLIIRHQHFSWPRNVLCGAGLAYACANENYWHIPLAWLAPSMYVGYQAYKGRDQVRDFIVGRTYNHDRATAV